MQVGGGITSDLGRFLGLSSERVKALIPVGASAAIAAAFNAPLAAVMFSLEEITGDLHAPILGSVVFASATSWFVLRLLLGNHPLFHVPQYQLANPLEFGIYAILGDAGGLVSAAFTKLLLRTRESFMTLPKKPLVTACCWWPACWRDSAVCPTGIRSRLWLCRRGAKRKNALGTMAPLVVLKLCCGHDKLWIGNTGGIFGPSLFIGAMLGGADRGNRP